MAADLERVRAALSERYTVERELGRGGMATVYLAHDLRHDRHVAIKVLRPEVSAALGPERFLREIQIAARLDHPQILPLYDSGEVEGVLYAVMPYVEGESLRERLLREKQLAVDEAVRLAREVADALSYAHSHGVVHRDVKPENILLTDGHARVADFGIAKAIGAAGGDRLTATGLAVGTPAYMSPEQASGEQELDGRSDVYSLGCVLYEMLAGEAPYTGPTPQAVLAKRLHEPVPHVSTLRETVSPALEAVVTRALARAPADRFATAQGFADALAAALAAPARAWSAARRRRRQLALTVSAAGVLVLGAALLLLRRSADSAINAVAVLPLVNLSGDPAQEYFSDGMTEELITELSRVGTLGVISRTSAMRYKGTDKSLPEIARELGVQAVIEGSVRRVGERVRITVQLVDARRDRHLWAGNFDRELRDVLALHTDVARAIVGRVRGALSPAVPATEAARPVRPEAYDEYLRGTELTSEGTTKIDAEAFQRGLAHLARAIELDSSFALAHYAAGQARLAMLVVGLVPAAAVYETAERYVLRALALDPNLAQAHGTLAELRAAARWDWDAAEEGCRRAMELNPRLYRVLVPCSDVLSYTGRHTEALELSRRAVELDPLSARAHYHYAFISFLARQYDSVLAAGRRALALDPELYLSYTWMGWAHFHRGTLDSALAWWEDRRFALRPPFLAYLYARMGRTAEARAILSQLLAAPRPVVAPSQIALIYVGLGDHDSAFAWFDRGVRERDYYMIFVKVLPDLDPLRTDPRYDALLRRIGLDRDFG